MSLALNKLHNGDLPCHSDDEGVFFHLIAYLVSRRCYGIVIEDVQYCDESSWKVLKMMSQLLLSGVVLLTAHVSRGVRALLSGSGSGKLLRQRYSQTL